MTYATLAGPITLPGSDTGVQARVYAIPRTKTGMLTYTGDDRLTIGPVIGTSDAAGSLGDTLKVPTNVAFEVYWTIVVKPINPPPGVPTQWTVKRAATISGSGTVKLRDLAEITVTAVSTAIVENVAALLASAQAAKIAAETARTGAEAARDTVLNQKGAADGIAPLDGTTKVPTTNLPASTTSGQGIVELATTGETTTGTDTSRAVTPAGVKAVVDPIRDLSDPTFGANLTASFAPVWKASTAYTSGAVVTAPDGSVIARNGSGTSRPAFDATEKTAWVPIITKAGTLAQIALATTFAAKVELNAVTDGGLSTSGTAAANYAAMNTFFNTTVANLIDAGTAVKVIIPPGDYLMSLGLYVHIPAAKGGLHVSGYGARLIFGATPTGSWCMFKVRPVGSDAWIGTPPANTNDYIRDIYIEGLGIYDPDPIGHKGAEETHGINVAYAKNAHIWNCRLEGTGDEPIEVDYVEDFTIHDNNLYNCKATEGTTPDGANISIKNGCRRGKIYANSINTSVGDGSKGIQVKIIEAATVEDIEVWGNSILNVEYAGLWINTSGAAAKRVRFHHNTVDGTATGIGNAGTGVMDDCGWDHNTIRNCSGTGANIQPQGASVGCRFDGNSIMSCGTSGTATSTYGLWVGANTAGTWASIHANKIRSIQGTGIYLTGNDVKVSGGEVRDVNLAGTANQAAIRKSAGTGQVVENIIVANPGARGIQAIDYVRHCRVTGNTGDAAVTGHKEINGGYYVGRIAGIQPGGAILNAEIDATGYTAGNAVDVSTATDCRVVGNKIRAYNAGGRRAWSESAGADRNLFANNIYYGATNVVGAASVSANNIAMAS